MSNITINGMENISKNKFDNMIVKGVRALNNREYKEEKEISDDE